jgi:hypothetical protein
MCSVVCFLSSRFERISDKACGVSYIDEGILFRVMEILKLDESCSSNPKSEIANWTGSKSGARFQFRPVQSEISDFGFELQDSSNFKIGLRAWRLDASSMLTPS